MSLKTIRLYSSELSKLEAANAAGGVKTLHIYGHEGARNDHLFTDYPVLVTILGSGRARRSLAEGRKLFGGRTVPRWLKMVKGRPAYTGSRVAIQDIPSG